MQEAEVVLSVLRERGRKGLPLTQLYRQMFNKDLYLLAYGNIYSNQGAMTPGASAETADGMSEEKISQIIGLMRSERYRFSPARRAYIPKKNGKLRPLGLPSWSDKLAGEVVRLLLEAYYDPGFSDRSHGFRKGRGCHTALREIHNTWTGTTWFIEGDISDCLVAPMLAGSYTDQVGRKLFAAAAWLCDVAGFMCFDSGRQGLGQRYFVSGLRMAKMSGDQALGAKILTHMSMQAQLQRHPPGAVAFADAAVGAARESGSASTLAFCHAIRACALALRGDASGSDQALNQAERALDRADPQGEPSWIAFFTPQALAAEAANASAELGRASLVRRHAAGALSAADSVMQRRHVLVTATLATSYLPAEDAPTADGDVEQACTVLRGVLPVLGSLTSTRVLGQVSAFRKRLAGYAQLPAVQELERDLDQCLAGTAA